MVALIESAHGNNSAHNNALQKDMLVSKDISATTLAEIRTCTASCRGQL